MFKMRFKKAERNIHNHAFTFVIVPSYHERSVWNMEIENWKFNLTLIILVFTISFSLLINKYSPQLINTLSSYQVATLEQKEVEQKLIASIQNSIVLKDRLRYLRKREANLRDLLSLSPRSHLMQKKEKYYDYPIITTQKITSKKGEFGKVLIDEKPIIEFFDARKNRQAGYRARVTSERIKDYMANKQRVKKIKIIPSPRKTDEFIAEFNGMAIYKTTKEDASQFDTTPYLLAQKWRDDLMTALYLERKDRLSEKIFAAIQNFFYKRKELQYKKFEQFFSEIDYPAQTVAGMWQINDPRIRKVNHLISFIKKESNTRKNSYTNLSGIISDYKTRFAQTPSQAPVAYSFVLSPFGWRRHPLTRRMAFHTGIDLPCLHGSPIMATAAGEVCRQGWIGRYGYVVEVDHGHGIKSLYAHNSQILTRLGQHVRKGQVVARAGKTGFVSGVHVHYEVRINNRPINPIRFLNLDIFTACKNW